MENGSISRWQTGYHTIFPVSGFPLFAVKRAFDAAARGLAVALGLTNDGIAMSKKVLYTVNTQI